MRDNTQQEKAGVDYAAAHAAHYKTKNLHEALNMYTDVMIAYPDLHEAEYSRQQIQNMAKSVVPAQELVDAQKALIITHLVDGEPSRIDPAPAGPSNPAELAS